MRRGALAGNRRHKRCRSQYEQRRGQHCEQIDLKTPRSDGMSHLESTKKKGRKALHGAIESTVLTHCGATSSLSTSSASATGRSFAGASTCVAATMTNVQQQRDGEGAEGEIGGGGGGVDEQPTPITIALQEQVSSLSVELRTAQAQLAEQSRTIARLSHDMAAIKQAMQQ